MSDVLVCGRALRAARSPVLVVSLGASVVIALALVGWLGSTKVVPAQTVSIPAGRFQYQPGGDFRTGNQAVDAPFMPQETAGFDMMLWPVSQADYALCVAGRACRPAGAKGGAADLAVTGVNFLDANDYAAWYSHATGQPWRLPTDTEWQRAAAERAPTEISSEGSPDPAKRWMTNYRAEVTQRGAADPLLHERGYFGLNSRGIGDLSGNVWEWTTGCLANVQLDADGTVLDSSDYCGARAIEGRHRAFLVDFVRDPRSGGCSVGLPPDFPGFRLVRDRNDPA